MIFHQVSNSQSNFSYNIATYYDTVWEKHFHKNMEVIYVIDGSVACTLNNKEYNLSAGDFGLCLPYEIHSYIPEKNASYFVLVFSGDLVRAFSKETIGKTGAGFIFKAGESVENYVKTQLIFNKNPSFYTLKSCLYALCEEYLLSIKLIEKEKNKADLVSLIVDFVSEKHTEKISLKDIATALSYDYNYMSRCFKNIFDMPFTNFVNLYRLETAIDLLDNSTLNIADVAYSSGFQSVRNFNDVFRKNLNMSPSQYRKASRK